MESPLLDIVSTFAQSVLELVLPILVVFVVAWVRAKIMEAKEWAIVNGKERELLALETIAGLAVQAAEQGNLAGYVEDKKIYAYNLVESYLKERGIAINLGLIDAAIEAAVWAELNSGKAVLDE